MKSIQITRRSACRIAPLLRRTISGTQAQHTAELSTPARVCARGALADPCMINSGVFFVRNGESARMLLRLWLAKQRDHAEIFGEQASLNEIRDVHPELIEILGGQVMNAHTAFDGRMAEAAARGAEGTADARATHAAGRLAYDIALRLTSGFQPGPFEDTRLNRSAYAAVARAWFGRGPGGALKQQLQHDVGGCATNPHAFICHPFARPIWSKQALATLVSGDVGRRAVLRKLLHTQQRMPFRTLEEAQNATVRRAARGAGRRARDAIATH